MGKIEKIYWLLEDCKRYGTLPFAGVARVAFIAVQILRRCQRVLSLRSMGAAPERDDTDYCLIETAIKNKIPVYGFCREMQSILNYFGCRLENVKQ